MVAEAETSWCELCRFDDPCLARAVATSIAAMEFDVRLDPGGLHAADTRSGSPTFVVEVFTTDWHELADVLNEIVDEQQEFDRWLADRQTVSRHARLVTVITLTGAADLLLLLGLLEW